MIDFPATSGIYTTLELPKSFVFHTASNTKRCSQQSNSYFQLAVTGKSDSEPVITISDSHHPTHTATPLNRTPTYCYGNHLIYSKTRTGNMQ